MISIPLPFVIALLMTILAMVLFIRQGSRVKPALVFIILCALTTTIVGLKLSFNLPLFRILHPIFAAYIPVAAWFCFATAHKRSVAGALHWFPPIAVMFGLAIYPFWQISVDPLLSLLYVGYGIALVHSSSQTSNLPRNIRFSDMDNALKAERLAGILLLASACIDIAIAINFSFFAGDYAFIILNVAHMTLLPIIIVAVVVQSKSVPLENEEEESNPNIRVDEIDKPHQLTDADIKEILCKVESLLDEQEMFLDPDLTLTKLARKTGIPARQISVAINKAKGRSISQVVNEYRIERARKLLATTDKSIIQVYLESGFHTKSNFNREFLKITGNTPSKYRHKVKN